MCIKLCYHGGNYSIHIVLLKQLDKLRTKLINRYPRSVYITYVYIVWMVTVYVQYLLLWWGLANCLHQCACVLCYSFHGTGYVEYLHYQWKHCSKYTRVNEPSVNEITCITFIGYKYTYTCLHWVHMYRECIIVPCLLWTECSLGPRSTIINRSMRDL